MTRKAKGSADHEICEDPKFQERMWKAERVGWGLIALLILGGLAGLLGHGPLARTVAAGPGGSIRIQYDRFGRVGSGRPLQIRIESTSFPDGLARLWVSRRLLTDNDLEWRSLLPEGGVAGPERVTYRFAAPLGSAALVLDAELTPRRAGVLRGEIGLEAGEAVALRQLVYP